MEKAYKTIITSTIPKEWVKKLSSISEVIIWPGGNHFLMPRDYLIKILPETDAIINTADVKADKELLNHASRLKIVANASIGYDNLNLKELTTRGIWACNTPGFFNYPVAEYIIAGMLTLSRKLGEAERFVRQNEWNAFEPGRWDGKSLKEMSIGIVGMGAIGTELMNLAKAFGMKVRYYDHNRQKIPGYTNLDKLLNTSDFVSINVPLNSSTKHMVNQNFLNKLKDDAILINTSRGAVVEQNALIKALKSGQIKGAILDVFENEPYVPTDLRKLENVFITPHIAGGTKSARKASMESAAFNVFCVLSGNKPINSLNQIE
ncbi:D-glycerate dehydrogenase [Maribellus comscasis]|uniref:D-glycerate dehydrogenase n=1 Tax=Maribellus comscasis TaxID=2681766 RepID=A0A6I6JXN4_9BACT|nr:NAD(P)-dependent oxidoreductase [Maribellus comscasis]QGY47835.1 D-glycerate dehydrogenase [Maribellus comscasis]